MSEQQIERIGSSVLVSVITCRRPAGVQRLIEHLLRLEASQCDFEILVVDNDIHGSAGPVLEPLMAGAQGKLRYQQEPQPGIVHARNRCVKEFLTGDHDALVFIDDDEWPADEKWLDGLVAAWRGAKADIVTSHVVSVGEAGVPAWALEILYGENRLQPNDRVDKFYTNNLLLSRKVLETVQPAFDHRFAMTGASDYHFALKCARAGFTAIYTDAPVVEEFPADRATLRWFLRRGFRSGVGYTRSHLFEEPLWLAVMRSIAMAGLRLAAGFLTALVGALKLSKAGCVQGLFRMASAVGSLAGLLGITHDEYQNQHETDEPRAS